MSKSVVAADWRGGVDNLAPADRVPETFVRAAVNVDPTPGGALHLRTGYEMALSCSSARGVLALGHKLLVADGAVLVEFDTRTGASRTLRSIAGAGQFIGDVFNDKLYLFTANEALVYDGDTVQTWGVPDVLRQPLPTVGDGGALPAGVYKVAVTFSNADGIEGGTDAPIVITAQNDGSALTVTVPTPPDGGIVNLYASPTNAATLYLQSSYAVSTTVTLNTVRSDTRTLSTAYMQAPMVGTVVRAHGAQIAVADGSTVWVTVPMQPHLIDRRRGFFQYPAEVNALLSHNDLFVSADKCYAVNSTTGDDPGQREVLDFPALRGTEVKLPDGSMAWMTKYGQAVTALDTRGTSRMELVNREHYAPNTAGTGAAAVLDHNGNQIIVTTTQGAQGGNPLSASDFFIGEVIRP